MKTLTKYKFIFIAILITLIVAPIASSVLARKVNAQSNESQPVKQENKQTKDNKQEETSYHYVAQPGDSYTLMARKAIQTYGIVNKVNLSKAKIIFAETLLTQQAGSPLLQIGQDITIKESTVKNWVEKANKLSKSEEAAWGAYTIGVNFNTNHVGEAS